MNYNITLDDNSPKNERHSGFSRLTIAFISFFVMLFTYFSFMNWEINVQREYAEGIEFISQAQSEIANYERIDSGFVSEKMHPIFEDDITVLKERESEINLKIIKLQTTQQFLNIIKDISYAGLAFVLWWLFAEFSIIVISPVKFESSVVHRFNMPVIIAVSGLIILALFYKGMP